MNKQLLEIKKRLLLRLIEDHGAEKAMEGIAKKMIEDDKLIASYRERERARDGLQRLTVGCLDAE